MANVDLTYLRTYDIDQNSAAIPLATRVFYDKAFLSVAMPLLFHDQFGTAAVLPRRSGDSYMWRRFKKFAEVSAAVTEGVTPVGGRIEYENVVATVKMYGYYSVITDWVDMIHVDPIISMTVKRLAEQAAESLDSVTRDIINAGTSVYRSTADTSSAAYGTGARSTVNGCLTKKVLDAAITALTSLDAKPITPPIGASPNTDTHPVAASFVCLIHPHVTHSLYQAASGLNVDGGFVPIENYGSTRPAYKGEVGKYRNVRFIESTHAKVWTDAGGGTNDGSTPTATYRSSGSTGCDVYSCLLIGQDAYGHISLAGAFQTFMDKAGGNHDPLHQRNTVAWKAVKTAAILNDDNMFRIEVAALW